MISKLHWLEIFIYFVVWVFSFSYAYYKVYLLGLSIDKTEISDFIDGWKFLERKKDNSDEEWELWANFSFQLVPWLVLHISVSEFMRYFSVEAIPLCYFMITLSALLSFFPIVVPAFVIILLCIFFAGMQSSSKCIIWIIGVLSLVFMNFSKDLFMETIKMSYEQFFLTAVLIAWFLIRCLDFALSETKGNIQQWSRFWNLLAYTFYLPYFFFGPFIPYDYFKLQIYEAHPQGFVKRILKLFFSLIKYTLYYCFLEFLSHFLYCNALHYDIENFIPNGLWTLSGIGFCMANFFYLKYLVIYGFSISIANYENHKTPKHPKCIYRIHLYSKMWRHFDRGFYLFMFRCIYSPVCGRKDASIYRKSFASFLCFSFVYIWHGCTISIFYWSLCNFFGLFFETLGRKFWKDPYINKWLVTNFSKENLRRLEALLVSPLWILAVISNFMFFGGYRMGMLFIEQLFKGSFLVHISVVIISYCMCQVSIEALHLENEPILR